MKQINATKDDAFMFFDELKKNGGCDLASFPTFLRFEYRDISKLTAATFLVKWAESRKITSSYVDKLKTVLIHKGVSI